MDGRRRAARTRGASAGLVVLAVTAFLAAPLLAVGVGAPADADTGVTRATTTAASSDTGATRTTTATADADTGATRTTTATPHAATTPADTATPGPSDDTPVDDTPAPTPPADGTPQQGTTPTGTPTAPPSGSPAVDPTIRDPGDVTTALARVRGTATPGHTVRVQVGAAGNTVCTTRATADGSWACTGPVRSGPEQVFAATDVDDASRGTALSPASDIVVPPTVTTTGTTAAFLVGTAVPGADVTVTVAGSAVARTAVADPSGRWRVSLRTASRADGPVTVTTTQLVDTGQGYRSELRSAASAPVTVVVDGTPPAAPGITTPRSGSTLGSGSVEIRGSGTAGDTVTVYADRVPVCRATVAADRWVCTLDAGTLRLGTVQLTALAVDRAGNHSPASSVVRVLVGTATPGAPGTGGPSASAGAHGGGHGTGGTHPGGTGDTGSAGTGTGTGSSGGTGSGSGSTSTDSSTGTGTGSTDSSTSTGSDPGTSDPRPDVSTDWALATHYDAAVPDIRSVATWRTAALAGAVALGFLVLVAVPLGLALRRTEGTPPRTRPWLTGRNRPRAERTPGETVLPGWAAATVSVVLAAVLLLLATGVAVEARYARLAVAVLLGSALLTAGAALATRWAAGADRGRIAHRVSPWLVVGAVAAAAVTRIADCSPAFALGVLLVPVLRPSSAAGPTRGGTRGTPGRAAGPTTDGTRGMPTDLLVRCATWRSTALLMLAVTGWVVHSAVVRHGAWSALVAETAITLCVGGVGSLVAGLLPLPGSTGAALWEGARVRFVALTAAACFLAAAISSAPSGRHVPTVAVVATAVACALAAAVVAWYRRRAVRTT